MRDKELDADLQDAAHRVADLSKRVHPRSLHQAHLRQELMRRHQELSAEKTRRAAGTFWPRLTGLKRLTLVAPPALAAAIAAGFLLLALQLSGHPRPQTVDAQRITTAAVNHAPTVKRWEWRFRSERPRGRVVTRRWSASLSASQAVYLWRGRPYLYSDGKWFLLPSGSTFARSMSDWQWAFVSLAARLADRHAGGLTWLPDHVVNGIQTIGVRFSLHASHDDNATATAWINRNSGLVVRMERVVMDGNKVIEHDTADYRYVSKR